MSGKKKSPEDPEDVEKSQDLTESCKQAKDEVAKIGELESQLSEAKQSHKSELEYLRSELQEICDQIDQAIAKIGEVKQSKIITPIPFKYDKTKDSWTCLPEDRGIQRITSIDQIKALDEVSFLEKGESCVNGEVMLQRAKAKGLDWSQYDAEYLLEHQDEIPKKLRKFCLPFTGTVWRDSGGYRYVAYLFWGGGEWCLSWLWLVDVWDSDNRLLSLCK